MPLINLQTNLKSLKYGHDGPNGGSSNQPYIQTDINNPLSNSSINLLLRNPLLKKFLNGVSDVGSFIGFNSFNADEALAKAGIAVDQFGKIDDGFIRGGAIGATNAAITDTIRIAKFFTDTPKGPLFLARQAAMQLTNPRLEWKRMGVVDAFKHPWKFIKDVGSSIATGQYGNIIGTASRGYLEPTRLYNLGINTIAQIPVNYIGGHILRHGLLPISVDEKYEDIVKFNNKIPEDSILNKVVKSDPTNRLLRLADKFELGDGKGDQVNASEELRKLKKAIRKRNRKGKKDARNARAQYISNSLSSRDASGNIIPDSGPGIGASKFIAVAQQVIYPLSMLFASNKLKTYGYKREKRPPHAKGQIDDYLTGPGSVYGIGFTSIKRYSYTEDEALINASLEHSRNNAGRYLQLGDSNKRYDLNYIDPNKKYTSLVGNALGRNKRWSTLSNTTEISDHPEVDNFDNEDIAKTIDGIGQNKLYSDYTNVADTNDLNSTLSINNPLIGIYTTIRKGGGGVDSSAGYFDDFTSVENSIVYNNSYNDIVAISASHWWKLSREANMGSGRRDSINLTPMFSANPGVAVDWDAVTINKEEHRIKDLVPFMIEAIDGKSPSTKSIYMVFRAYLTDLSDSVDADWADVKYAGRGEKFYIYTGFNRKISISFKVAALSEVEMKPMYRRLNALMGNLMPDYVDQDGGLMRGPLVRMTVGNYINSQPGKIDSLSYKVSNDSPWEINIDGDKDKLILPHIIEVQLNFTPIGSQTGASNRLSNKESDTNFVSHIAQNYNGMKENQYINGSHLDEEGTKATDVYYRDKSGRLRAPNPNFKPELIHPTAPGIQQTQLTVTPPPNIVIPPLPPITMPKEGEYD
jgi:hypothetical protein